MLLIVFITAPGGWRDVVCAALFAVATLTDFFDGFLARHLKTVSRFGEFLDPVADKIVVVTALLLLLDSGRAPLPAVFIIVGREICVLGLRQWMAARGQGSLVASSLPGKSKTALQMTAILLLFYQQEVYGLPTLLIGKALLWMAAALTLVSMFSYLRTVLTANGK